MVCENLLGLAPRGRAARILKERRDGLARAGRASRVGQGSIHLQMTGQPETWEDEHGGRTRGLASEHSASLGQNTERQPCPPDVPRSEPNPWGKLGRPDAQPGSRSGRLDRDSNQAQG